MSAMSARSALPVLLGGTRSRSACRFCASRISGAAYDACRREHQGQEDERVRVEPQVLRRERVPADPDDARRRSCRPGTARCPGSGRSPRTKPPERVGVAAGAADRGARLRGRSRRSRIGRLAVRAVAVVRRSRGRARPARRRCSRQSSGSRWSSTSSTVTAPSSRRPRRPPGPRPGCTSRVAGRPRQRARRGAAARVACRARRRPAWTAARAAAAGSARRRGSGRSASRAAGGTTKTCGGQRRRRGPGVADPGQRLGDGGVGRQDHRLGRHQAAGRVVVVGQQPAHVVGLLRLHQLEQPLPARGGQLGEQVGGVVGVHRLEHVGGALVVEARRGSRPGRPRAAPPGRRRAARRRARRRPRGAAWCGQVVQHVGEVGRLAAPRTPRAAGRPAAGAAVDDQAPRALDVDEQRLAAAAHSGPLPGCRRRTNSWVITQSRLRSAPSPRRRSWPCRSRRRSSTASVEQLAEDQGLGRAAARSGACSPARW